MQKFFMPGVLYEFPSKNHYHINRCIVRDGTLMWSDALYSKLDECINVPKELAHEQHIVKTAQRLEELNSWLVQPDFGYICINPQSGSTLNTDLSELHLSSSDL